MTAIQPLAPEEFGLVAGWLSDPAVNRWLTSDWRGRLVETGLLAAASRNRRNRLFMVREENQPAGLVALGELDAADRCAMVWYVLGERSLAGKGVTSRAVGLLCRQAFGELGLASLFAWIVETNTPSRRVLERNGFRRIGAMRSAACFEGRQLDRVYFDLLPGDLTP